VVREVARELAGRLAVVQVNTDLNPGLTTSYQIQMQGIPALLVIKGGQIVGRARGGMNKESLLEWVCTYL
jgi:thioredoxin-like negative regulator of GroEL